MCPCRNIKGGTYMNLVQPATHLGYMVLPIAPRLQAYTVYYCTKQNEIYQVQEKNNAIKRGDNQEIYVAMQG